MVNLYRRKVEVIAGTRKFLGEDFTIKFEVPFDDGPDPNIPEIKIYNLKGDTIKAIKGKQKVVINAGYKDDAGALFVGEVKQRITKWSGVDKVTTISCIDGGEKWFTKKYKKTYKKGVTAHTILNDLIKQTGLKAAVLKLPKNKTYKGGKVVDATLATSILEVAKDCGAKMHVTRGKMYIRPKSDGDKTRFIVNKANGLIGSPTEIEKQEKYTVIEKEKKKKKVKGKTVVTYKDKKVEKTRTRHGWKVVCFLNHRITTDALITIDSTTAKGTFRIESGVHKSDGNTFYSEMEVFAK